MEQIAKLIGNTAQDSLLRALDPDTLTRLLRFGLRRDLAIGETIIEQGDGRGDFAICLLDGRLKVHLVSANGREIILHYCRPGEVVGEIALLDSGPRTASVSAVEASSVLVIPASIFLETLADSPRSMVAVMRELARRLRQLNLVVEGDRSLPMAQRLARALVRLIASDQPSDPMVIAPSQAELGAFAGLARENVSRLLSQWEELGVVRREGHAIRIEDLEYLRALADL